VTTTALVKPKTCRRCKGEGIGGWRVQFGICFACEGTGKVEGDPATLAAAKAARELAQAVAVSVAAWTDRNRRGGLTSPAVQGLYALDALEPERAAKARLSIHAGHPGVDAALEAYWLAQGPSPMLVRMHSRWNRER